MPSNIELTVQPRTKQNGKIRLAATVDGPHHKTHTLWFQVPEDFENALTSTADPYVIGFLFPFMQWGRPVQVNGVASPSLLGNLELLSAIWHMRFPEIYHPVLFSADEEREQPVQEGNDQTLTCFSGGVDSCYTVWRHYSGAMEHRNRHITAGMVVCGFTGLPLDNPERYNIELAKCRSLLSDIGVETIGIACNPRELPIKGRHVWRHSHGTAIGACLSLFANRFRYGLIPNSITYTAIENYYGTSPLTDPLMSSSNFEIMDDGGEKTRIQKIRKLTEWPAAVENLRVCNIEDAELSNCCYCEKCIRTMLALRVYGISNPGCFKHIVSDRDIRGMKIRYPAQLRLLGHVRQAALEKGLGGESWIKALEYAMRRGIRRLRRKWVTGWLAFIPKAVVCLLRGKSVSEAKPEPPPWG